MGSPAPRAALVTLSRNRCGASAAATSAKPGTGLGAPGGSAAAAACCSRAARISYAARTHLCRFSAVQLRCARLPSGQVYHLQNCISPV